MDGVARARILVADSDADTRESMAERLRDDGHEVIAVADGDQVIEYLAWGVFAGERHGGFDLLVCGSRLGNCTGLHLLELMHHAHWTTPSIVLASDPAARARIEREGAVPLEDIDRLASTVTDVLRDPTPFDDVEDREDPILECVAARESGLDAFMVKCLLKEHGIEAFLERAPSVTAAAPTAIFVLERDVERARAIVARFRP